MSDPDQPQPQLDKFKELARELEADEDEAKLEGAPAYHSPASM